MHVDVTSRTSRAFIYLGKISYGLYVIHYFCLYLSAKLRDALSLKMNPFLNVAFDGVFALTLTIVLAALSYRYLEKPFLKLKRRFN